MTTGRAPLDRLVDLAVAVPSCTFVAARRAVPLAARVGTQGTARLVGRVSEAVHELRSGGLDTDVQVDEIASPPPVEASEGEAAILAESISADELPIEGYDLLAARQVVDRLGTLDRPDLARIEIYERAHRNRSTVLGKISMLSA